MSKFYLIDREALGIGKAKREAFENPAYADSMSGLLRALECIEYRGVCIR